MQNKNLKFLLVPVISLVMLLGATLTTPSAFAALSRQPYLQSVSDTRVVLRWRTTAADTSRVSYGPEVGNLNTNVDIGSRTREHEVVISGLTPNTKYFYAVGSTSGIVEAGNDAGHYFITAPSVGSNQKIRIWAIGDPGTGTANQRNVRNAYYNLDDVETNVVLTLGDNAYNSGTDSDYTSRFFNVYNDLFRHTAVWATRGNHETNLAAHETAFTHPTQAEAGGTPSGSELYYSFDYGNVHFVCLDSFTSSNLNGTAMYTWLENDLASTTQKWIIAFWHHPPYSRSSNHDSNREVGQKVTRERANPILEKYGVDLQLGGHNHFYSRTFLINNHYGLSGSYDAAIHAIDGGNGRTDGDGVYQKGSAPEGAVYVLAGSSGKTGYTPIHHPANFTEVVRLGSMVIDVEGDRMDVRMLRENGAIQDYFSITKAPADTIAPAVPSGLAAIAGNTSVSLDWTANVEGDLANYTVKRSTTMGGPYTTIATAATNAYDDTAVSNGTSYFYVVSAFDTSGNESGDSTQVSATPDGPPDTTPPAVPSGLAVTAGDVAVSLNWARNGEADLASYNLKRSSASGGPYATIASATARAYNDTGVSNGTTYYYVVSAVDASGNESADSTEVSAIPVEAPADGADLVVEELSATPVTVTLKPRGRLKVTLRTSNQGTQRTNRATYTRVMLSEDAVIDASDRQIKRVWVPRLAAGKGRNKRISVKVPKDLAPGSYYIGAIVDLTDRVAETDDNNNTRTGPLITAQ